MEQHSDQIRARITGTGNLLREIFACLFPVLGMLYAFSHAAVALYLCAGVTGGYLPSGTCVPRLVCLRQNRRSRARRTASAWRGGLCSR